MQLMKFASDLEEKTASVLEIMKLIYKTQYIIPTYPSNKYRFDFFLEVNGRKYLLEVDGSQHFIRSTQFHKTEEAFFLQQESDRYKMRLAYNNCFIVVRLHYTEFKSGWISRIYNHLASAFSSGNIYYFSNIQHYKYLESSLVFPSYIGSDVAVSQTTNQYSNVFEEEELDSSLESESSEEFSEESSEELSEEFSEELSEDSDSESNHFTKILTKKMIRRIRTLFW
jgi:hypothetical protein